MPLIMEDSYNMDVDDLFGDSEPVNLPTIALPPLKGLARRLDELYTLGCCQKIAWSKSGSVAYITPDGQAVNLKIFKRDPSTGKWDLGKDRPMTLPHDQAEYPIVHLSWSHLGTDLAILDAAGRLIIFSMVYALDRMSPVRTHLTEDEDEVSVVVGMHWLSILPHEKRTHIAWSASGRDDKWNFQIGLHINNDAHHPADSKASLIYVTKNGQVKLRYQQIDNSWHEASAQLVHMISVKETYTHAAFASNNDNTLLLATYDSYGGIELYRIKLNWAIPQPKSGLPPKPFPPPSIEVISLTSRENCYPLVVDSLTDDTAGTDNPKLQYTSRLTHFNFLPSTPEQTTKTVPTIQAIFVTPPNLVSLDQPHGQHTSYSVVVRWEFEEERKNVLHPSLDMVTSKKKSVGSIPPRTTYLLKRQPDHHMHSIILSVFPLWYNMILAFCHSDGAIEFRSRTTMEIFAPNYNTETVTSLSQAGFAFPPLDPCLHVALSPNYCMAVGIQHDGSVKLKSMEYNYGSLNNDENDPKHAAAIVALVLQTTTGTNQYFSTDDIFATMGDISEKRREDFLSLLLRAININLDCGVEESQSNYLMLLGRSPTLVKTLSAGHLLGLQGSINRTFHSKICWVVLNIKYITQSLTTITRMHQNLDKTLLRPEVVNQMVGVCRWTLHFMTYMLDELMKLGREMEGVPPSSFDRPLLESKVKKLNTPIIAIMLNSFCRTALRQWTQPLAWMSKTCTTYMSNSQTPLETRRLYAPLSQAMQDMPFHRQTFEALITETQHFVRSSYKRAGLIDVQRNEVEREVLLGKVPEVLLPVARRLATETLYGETGLLNRVDVARVMFFSTTWLGLTYSKQAAHWFDTHVVDVCQKMILRGTGTQTHYIPLSATNMPTERDRKKTRLGLKQCTRCGAYMEDVLPGSVGYTNQHISWLMSVGKHCVCNNHWMLADEKPGAK